MTVITHVKEKYVELSLPLWRLTRVNAPNCLSTKTIKSSAATTVLCKLQFENHQLLVINLLENSSDTFQLSDLSVCQSNSCEELGRFEVQGQLCVIVKIESLSLADIDLINLLTERELQIATLVASGQGNKQIANQLRISEWTVSAHLRRIFIKLNVDSRAAMVYRCAPIIQKLFRKVEMTHLLR
jgi:DNA-binding CsgD family transcriptional regulator